MAYVKRRTRTLVPTLGRLALKLLHLDVKQILGLVFTLAGAGALVYGVIKIFEGGEALNGGSWAAAILGVVFFSAGIGLMKASKSTS